MKELAKNIYQHKLEKNLPFKLTKTCAETFLAESLDLIVPGMVRKGFSSAGELENYLKKHQATLEKILTNLHLETRTSEICHSYLNELLDLSKKIELDAIAMFEGDPAAKNISEVLICYPGLYAIAVYRLAHFFQLQNVELLPRLLTEIAHEKTGIDIHPGATIGESFHIDHGTGIVIGESAIIGSHVKIYQGVTLGALSVDKSMAKQKRHPTIEDGCVIYSHATILGGETVVGQHSVIGGNVWLTKSVAAFSMVYHKSEVRLGTKKDSHIINLQEELIYEI